MHYVCFLLSLKKMVKREIGISPLLSDVGWGRPEESNLGPRIQNGSPAPLRCGLGLQSPILRNSKSAKTRWDLGFRNQEQGIPSFECLVSFPYHHGGAAAQKCSFGNKVCVSFCLFYSVFLCRNDDNGDNGDAVMMIGKGDSWVFGKKVRKFPPVAWPSLIKF